MFTRVSNDYIPLFWAGRLPVYVTTLLISLYTAAMIALTLSAATGFSHGGVLVFSSDDVLQQFALWRMGTYVLVQTPTLGFAIEMLCLFWFGREVERYLGRRSFLGLYITLLFVAPAVLLFAGPMQSSYIMGTDMLHLCIFAAFAVLYPRAELIFRIQARWAALVIVGISILQRLSAGDWPELCALVVMLICLAGFLAHLGVSNAVWLTDGAKRLLGFGPSVSSRRAAPQRPSKRSKSATSARQDPGDEIDAILEKISSKGISSLTPEERQRLENARKALLAQEDRH